MLPEEDCVHRVKVVINCLNTLQTLFGWHGVLLPLCSIGLAEQMLNAMAPHLALSTSSTLLRPLPFHRLLTVQAPVSWCVFASVFHHQWLSRRNAEHQAQCHRPSTHSRQCFHMFRFTYMHVHDTCEGGGGGGTRSRMCADQDVCLMFKQFKKLKKKL